MYIYILLPKLCAARSRTRPTRTRRRPAGESPTSASALRSAFIIKGTFRSP